MYRYRPLVQRKPTVTRTIKEWSADAVQNVKGSLECTGWDVFVDSESYITELNTGWDVFVDSESYITELTE